MLCPECGNENLEPASECQVCGASLLVPTDSKPAPIAAGPDQPLATLLYEAAIGPVNTAYYLKHFERFDARGKPGLTWHWPAFLATFAWMAFRRMWKEALLFAGLCAALGLGLFGLMPIGMGYSDPLLWAALAAFVLLASVIPALGANALYHRFCNQRITHALGEASDIAQARELLGKTTSTRRRAQIVGSVLALVWLTLAALAVWAPWHGTEPAAIGKSAVPPTRPASAANSGKVQEVARAASAAASAAAAASAPTAPASRASAPQAPASATSAATAPAAAASAAAATAGKPQFTPVMVPVIVPVFMPVPFQTAPVAAPAAAAPAVAAPKAAASAVTPAAPKAPVKPGAGAPPDKPVSAAPAPAVPAAVLAASTPAVARGASKPVPPAPAVAPKRAAAPVDPASKPPLPALAAAPRKAGFMVAVGLFAQPENVDRALAKLRSAGLPALSDKVNTKGGSALTRVWVGPYDNADAAKAAVPQVQQLDLPAVVVQLRY